MLTGVILGGQQVAAIRAPGVSGGVPNGFIERLHRTLLEEHLHIKGGTIWYETIEEMQKEPDAYLETDKPAAAPPRPQRGGRPPYEVFKAGISRKHTCKPSALKEV